MLYYNLFFKILFFKLNYTRNFPPCKTMQRSNRKIQKLQIIRSYSFSFFILCLQKYNNNLFCANNLKKKVKNKFHIDECCLMLTWNNIL